MKALSLKQPYAELVVSGKKKIELRKWNTKFRGEFLIHAPKHPDEEAMKKFGFKSLPVSCIVGKATLKGVKTYGSPEDCDKDKELHLASNDWGKFGFILENPQRIKEIPCGGNLGFWEFKSAFSNL
jgi:predicted transcriptional regulator